MVTGGQIWKKAEGAGNDRAEGVAGDGVHATEQMSESNSASILLKRVVVRLEPLGNLKTGRLVEA